MRTGTLEVQAAPAPRTVSPPANVQGLVFATARDGWLVTSGPLGTPQGGHGAVYRTTDGGATWDEVWRGQGVQLHRIGVLPGTGHLYVAGVTLAPGDSGGAPMWMTSDDGGETWQSATPQLPVLPSSGAAAPSNAWSLTWPSLNFDFASTDIGFAAVDPEDWYGASRDVVLRTDDGGRTWHTLPLPVGLQATGGLDFLDARHGWITGAVRGTCNQVWQTSDGGQTWQPVPETCPPFGLYAVDFPDAEHGFASGGALPFIGAQTGILATSDGGAHWHVVYHTQGPSTRGPATHLLFSSSRQGWAWGGTCKTGQNGPCGGEVLVTHDGGQSWQPTGIGALTLSAVGDSAWAQGDLPAPDAIWQSSDGGRTWQQHLQPQAADPQQVSTAPGSPGTVWLTTGAGTYATSDGGVSWTQAAGGDARRASADVLFATGPGGLRVSRDGGRTWAGITLPGGRSSVDDIAFATPSAGWAILGGPMAECASASCSPIARTTDGGGTWSAVGAVPIQGSPAFLAFTPVVGVAVGYGRTSRDGPLLPALALSRDGGAHWAQSLLPAAAACFRPAAVSDAIWLPCVLSPAEGLLLHSIDGGHTWTEWVSRAVVPETLAMTDTQHGWMVAAGLGPAASALYRTSDGGATWSQLWPSQPAAR